ncbi:LOW QUALITY PROTEIN: hypothetical protein HID58_073897 [Brassica napus]|uniref:Uncharacterized protein n=1 Tax=Brassica napus TaxID=3708 RepID=A0ABQ7YFD8_BRANA|nr:LOW QUALITY PROTEIN: hypothetical protein HID58_073897 [Brassica napus]
MKEILSVDPSLEEKTIKHHLGKAPIFLFAYCEQLAEMYWCRALDNMSGSKGEEGLAEYQRALEVMSVKKPASKKAALTKNDDEVRFIKSNKPTVLATLNTKVFPLTPLILPKGDSLASIQLIQGDLLQVMCCPPFNFFWYLLFHLGERMDEHASLKADLAGLTFQLREEKNNVLAEEKEIKALKLKVRNQDEAGALAAAENVSVREQLEQREEEVCNLRCAMETFDVEKTMAVNGTIVDLEGALKQYKMDNTSEAELQGIPAPTFEGEPWIPNRTETEETPELVCESMDSSESSLDLTAKIEELRNATVGEAPPSPGGDRFSPVGPLSVIGVEEVVSWRRKFRLPDDVTIRIPRPCDRVSDFELGEVPVYEGFFESETRFLLWLPRSRRISPGQQNPPFWRILIAMQNLGDLEGFIVCVLVEKRFMCWSFRRLRKKFCPVFEGCWTLKFAFMSFPGLSPNWCVAVMSRSDYPSGRDTVEQLLELPLERHEVSFLVSAEALNRCSIRDVMSGSRGDEALAEYKKALETMSTRKAAAKRTAPVEDEEVQFVGSSRRQATTFTATSFSKKKSKVSALKSSPPVSDNWSKVLANLNTKAFPLTAACLASDGDSSMAIRSLQGDRLQAASQLFHLGERMEDKTTTQAEVDALTAQLREEKDAVLAKEREIKALKLKVQNQEEALERVAMENASLQKQLDHKEEDICELRYAAEVFDDEKAMAVNGAKVVACWELMREWLHRHSWEPAAALEQYKTVKTTEAEVLGLSVPFFDDEPQVPKRGGAPESADDPLTN